MKKLLLLPSLLLGLALHSQTDTLTVKNVTLDLLKTPSNAAFTVMGTTPSEIQQPTNAPAFVLAVQNASNSFSEFPNNFGFAVTPFWFTSAKALTFKEDFSTENTVKAKRMYRNFRVSAGVVSNVGDDPNLWRYGLGLQTNILEGRVDSSRKAKYFDHLSKLNKQLFEKQNEVLAVHLQTIEGKLEDAIQDGNAALIRDLQQQRDALAEQILAQNPVTTVEMEEALMEDFRALEERFGWKWDIGLATAFDLQSNKLDSSSLYRLGGWTTFGYSLPPGQRCQLSILGAGRFYYYDAVVYALETGPVLINDLGVVDGGLRLVLDAQKLSLSFEGLYRYGFSDAFEPTYKLNAMLNYRFAENRMVYFAVGNDFNDSSVGDPDQLRVQVGINLGFGDKADIKK